MRKEQKDCSIWGMCLLLPIKICLTKGWGQRPRFWKVDSWESISGLSGKWPGSVYVNWAKEREGARYDWSGRDLQQIDLGLPKWVFGDRQLEESGCLGKDLEIGTAWGILGDSLWGWDHGSWDSAQALSHGVSLHDQPLFFHNIPVSFIVQKVCLHEILQFYLVKESLVCRMLIAHFMYLFCVSWK